jgi:hypothetical protein
LPRAHPEALAKLGLAEHVNAALRLMDASGQPEPWAQKPVPMYQQPMVIATLAGLAAALLIATIMLLLAGQQKDTQIAVLQDAVKMQPLQPATKTRAIVLKPSRSGPAGRSQVTIGGRNTELADFKFDVSWAAYNNFRVQIDRVDQGRVAVLTNLSRDSNGHLRVALNSSAVGPGDYELTFEGLDWRGAPVPQAWTTITVVH